MYLHRIRILSKRKTKANRGAFVDSGGYGKIEWNRFGKINRFAFYFLFKGG